MRKSGNLFSVLSDWNGTIILTSRKGKYLHQHNNLQEIKESGKPILVVFGSTDKGVHDILGNKINNLQNSKTVNFFPNFFSQSFFKFQHSFHIHISNKKKS